jgi:hypothetical protein|tara:strand:+ start:289 stop:519 length:231 start_codon:yes stop_codon:yes gene_type:complete
MNNIIIRPINTIKNVNGQTTEHFLNQDKISKLYNYLNKNGFKYNWQEIPPNQEFNFDNIKKFLNDNGFIVIQNPNN